MASKQKSRSPRTRDADRVSTNPVELQNSSLRFTAGMTDNKSDIRASADNPPQPGLTGLTLPIIDRAEEGRINKGSPRTKAFFATDGSLIHWNIHGQATRYGQFTRLGAKACGDQT